MKVGFDISQIAHQGGVATYTINLAEQLLKIPKLKMVFFYSSLRKPYQGDLAEVKSYKIPPTVLELFFNKIRFIPIERFIGEVDVFHSSDWMQPKTYAKKITTYHDLVPLKYPQWSNPKIIAVHQRRLSLVEKEIDMVIAVSEATKKDLLSISHLPKEKITVIYEAAGEQFKPQKEEEVAKFKAKYQLPDEFILAIGGLGERRNLKMIKEASQEYNLVITGQTIPYLLESEMPYLYSAAKVLLYSSFYEGFGLPILEAFACGTPVITSSVAAMPEIGGKAAVYVDPLNLVDIKKKLALVIGDDSLRGDMIQNGFQQAAKFSWEKCAQQTAQIYQKVCHEK